jgi:tRNA(fMet)-specific endonuclease VapC
LADRGVLIDASVLIDHFRRPKSAHTTLRKAWELFSDCFLSAVTVYEVELGARLAGRESDLVEVLPHFKVIPLGQAEAKRASELHAALIKQNLRISHRDALIAGTALVHGLPLLTENEEHFQRVPGLKLAKKELQR